MSIEIEAGKDKTVLLPVDEPIKVNGIVIPQTQNTIKKGLTLLLKTTVYYDALQSIKVKHNDKEYVVVHDSGILLKVTDKKGD